MFHGEHFNSGKQAVFSIPCWTLGECPSLIAPACFLAP